VPDPRFSGAIEHTWQTRLDQLENLLRGHPTDWREPSSDSARARRAN